MNSELLKLYESILRVDDKFDEIIHDLSRSNNIASRIANMVDMDVETDQNFIKISDKNDEVEFTNDRQAQKTISDGKNPFDKKGNLIKIGRFARKLISSNGSPISDKEVEDFVNIYKNKWEEVVNGKFNITLVSGEDIRKYYNSETYYPSGGSLNNSCMRYARCGEFLNIYVENPEVCQLIIYLDIDGKLLSRSLLWKCNKNSKIDYYVDRIYSAKDKDDKRIKDYVNSVFSDKKIEFFDSASGYDIDVEVKAKNYGKYPYMDTYQYFYPEKGILTPDDKEDSTIESPQFHLQATDGNYEMIGFVFSRKYNRHLPEKDAVWCEHDDDNYPKEDCYPSINIYGDIDASYVRKEDAVYSEVYKGWIHEDDTIEDDKWGIIPIRSLVTVIIAIDEDGKKTYEKMPRIFRNDKFIILSPESVWDSTRYGILKELCFEDISGKIIPIDKKNEYIGCVKYHGYKSFPIPIVFSLSYNYVSKKDSEIFKVPDTGKEIFWIKKEEYLKRLYPVTNDVSRTFNFDHIKSQIESSDLLSEEDKTERIEYLEKRHLDLLNDNFTYRFNYLNRFVKIDMPKVDLFNSLFSANYKIFENLSEFLNKFPKDEISNIMKECHEDGNLLFNKPVDTSSVEKFIDSAKIAQKEFLFYTYLECALNQSNFSHNIVSIFENSFDVEIITYYEIKKLIISTTNFVVISELIFQKIRDPKKLGAEEILGYTNWNSCIKTIANKAKECFNIWYKKTFNESGIE